MPKATPVAGPPAVSLKKILHVQSNSVRLQGKVKQKSRLDGLNMAVTEPGMSGCNHIDSIAERLNMIQRGYETRQYKPEAIASGCKCST